MTTFVKKLGTAAAFALLFFIVAAAVHARPAEACQTSGFLACFDFTVYDSTTGAPIQGALITVSVGPLKTPSPPYFCDSPGVSGGIVSTFTDVSGNAPVDNLCCNAVVEYIYVNISKSGYLDYGEYWDVSNGFVTPADIPLTKEPPVYSQSSYGPVYSQSSYGPVYSQSSYGPVYSQSSYAPAYSQSAYVANTWYLQVRGFNNTGKGLGVPVSYVKTSSGVMLGSGTQNTDFWLSHNARWTADLTAPATVGSLVFDRWESCTSTNVALRTCTKVLNSTPDKSDPNWNSIATVKVYYKLAEAKADLTSDLDTPSSTAVGTDMNFSGRVQNIGPGKASSSTSRFRLDIGNNGTFDLTLGTPAVNGLSAGSTSATFFSSPSWPATIGTHRIELCSDINNVISESDEANNCISKVFTVTPKPASAWLETVKGDVASVNSLDVTAPAGRLNGDFLALASSIVNFTSAKKWLVTSNVSVPDPKTYQQFFSKLGSKASVIDSTAGDVPATAGVFVMSSSTPTIALDGGQIGSCSVQPGKNVLVVFINGKLRVSGDLNYCLPTILIVKESITIDPGVKNVKALLLADKGFASGNSAEQLLINGSVMAVTGGSGFINLQRNLGAANASTSSEKIVFEPKYLYLLSSVLDQSRTFYSEERP